MKSVKILVLIIGVLTLTYCSSNNDKGIFKEGKELVSKSKFDEAIVKFQEVVQDYPKSELADSALFEMAKIYQGQVIKNLASLESLRKSVETYGIIVKKYPDSKLAESSLFMAAFILANELHEYPRAEKLYKLYIKKYPNGDLLDDAKVELSNLGKSPEEILGNKVK
jgi:TolA-binding protein